MKRRIELDMSQEDLALICESNQPHITKIESGQVNISFISLLKIASALKCKISDFTPFP